MQKVSRRSLLVIGGGALAVHALGCGGTADSQPLAATIAAGSATELSSGTLRPLAGQGVAIGRDSAGIYALTLICTHAGCDMSGSGMVSGSGIQCQCHGSQFNAQGAVISGPARSNLVHFAVTQDNSGQLTIHTDQEVPASTRLA